MTMKQQHGKAAAIVLALPNNGFVRRLSKTESEKPESEAAKWLWKLSPHVALEWDTAQEKIVSKRDQIGISWHHLSPYSKSVHRYRSGLADVITVPHELFELNDLKHVLSLEAWKVCLSDSERQFLFELLPKDVDRESIVRSLLRGDDFHFGNPLASWGASLIKGDVHPDSICTRESELKIARKAYYVDLKTYNDKLLESLRALKEIWTLYKNPGKDLLFKLQSWAKEKVLEGANMNAMKAPLQSQAVKTEGISVARERDMQINHCKVEVGSLNEDMAVRPRLKRRKTGILQEATEKTDIMSVDGILRQTSVSPSSVVGDSSTEVVCTLKVSRKQYTDILNLKAAGEEPCLDSLSSILGDSHSVGIQFISTCDKKDKLKICEYWSLLVQKDMPAAHATFVERSTQKGRLAKSLAYECMHLHSQFWKKEAPSVGQRGEFDDESKIGETSKFVKMEQLHQSILHGNSSPMSPVRQNRPGKHTVECLAQDEIPKVGISIPKQLSVFDSSCFVANAQSDMQAQTVASAASLADVKKPSMGQTLQDTQIFVEKRLTPTRSTNIRSSSFEEDKIGKAKKSARETEGLPKHGKEEILRSSILQQTGGVTESEVVAEEDEVSAIKNIWSSANLDVQQLHSGNEAVPNVKKNDSLIESKNLVHWDSPSKPVNEIINMNSMRAAVSKEGVDHRNACQVDKQCSRLDAQLVQAPLASGFQNREQLTGFPQGGSFLGQQELLLNGHGCYSSHLSKSTSPTNKRGLQHHAPWQDSTHTLNEPYQNTVSLSSNEYPQTNDLSLKQYHKSERHGPLFQTGQERSENQQKQQMMLPKFLDQTSRSEGFLNLHESNNGKLMPSVHMLQSRGRQNGLNEHNQAIQNLLSESGNEHSSQNYGAPVELRLLADGRSADQHGHRQQSELIRLQSDPQTLGQHQPQTSRPFPFQQLPQNQQYQHSTQDLLSSNIVSPMLSGWPCSQQMYSGRSLPSNTHFVPSKGTGQWNSAEEPMQTSWPRVEVHSQCPRSKNEEIKVSNVFPHWNQLPSSSYVVDNGLQKLRQYPENARTSGGSTFHTTDDYQGFRVQDDWACVQPPPSNQHYNSSNVGNVVYRGPGYMSWTDVLPGMGTSHQISQYEQQALQDCSLSKTNSHLGTPFDFC